MMHVLALIAFYQRHISRFVPGGCIYQPSCSAYTALAIERYGLRCGVIMGGMRILRCNPLARGGLDPVPRRDDDPLLSAAGLGRAWRVRDLDDPGMSTP